MAEAGTYLRPKALSEALDVLARGPVTIAAGCTDLFPATERKVLPGDILDITGIEDLRKIQEDDTGLRIGATTTWTDLATAKLPPAFDGLKLAALEVGGRQIQNQGTIAGNLCNASPAADGVPPLLTLDASVILEAAEGSRQLALSEFLEGPRKTARRPGELMTGLHIPRDAMTGQSHFLKLGARRYLVISIAMTAARITVEHGLVTGAALAAGSCGPVATRIGAAERALIGGPLNPDAVTDDLVAQSLSPIDDVRADAAYRATAAAELLRRTLRAFVERKVA